MDALDETPYLLKTNDLTRISALSDRVHRMRQAGQLTFGALTRLRKAFKIKDIYNSNAIEGNLLDIGETRLVVEQGLTLSGKSLKDQAEAKNLSNAIDYLEELATKPNEPLTERDLREIHLLVLKGVDDRGAGSYRTIEVAISGSKHKPPRPEEVQSRMTDYGNWLKRISVHVATIGTGHSVLLLAVAAHAWLVHIHPFVDGNGRVARLLMNLILMRNGYPIAIIEKSDRMRYYDGLQEADDGNLTPVVDLVADCVEETLEYYEDAVKEQRLDVEWTQALAKKFSQPEVARAANDYEVWKNSMELLKSYFSQISRMLDGTSLGKIHFKEYGLLELEKYLNLKRGGSAKKTWYFRIDFYSGGRAVRYLFFFESASALLRKQCDVTVKVSREERPGFYERLDKLTAPNVPALVEFGFLPKEEKFIARCMAGGSIKDRVEVMGRRFFEEVIDKHFSSK